MRKIFLFAICSILSFQYLGILSNLPIRYWLHYIERPFVYRCLIPLLAQDGVGILVLVALFCSGLILAMLYLYEKYWIQSLRNDAAFIIIYLLITLFLTRFPNYYDFPSIFFFLILFILFENKKYLVSVPVFILACLNRETAIFLIPVLLLMSKRFSFAALFAVVFLAVRFSVLYAFRDAPGVPSYNNLLMNFELHATYYLTATIFMVLIGLGFVAFAIVNSAYLPANIFAFIAIVLPGLLAVYMIFGVPTEIRVLAEVMPLLFMSALMKPSDQRVASSGPHPHSLLQILNVRGYSWY